MVPLLVLCHSRCGMLENLHCSMIISIRALGRNFQPFTGNGYFSIWVKKSQEGQKNPNKQWNKHYCLTRRLLYFLHPFTMRQSVGLTSMCVLPHCKEIRNVLPRHLYKILIVFKIIVIKKIGFVRHIYVQNS